jgi:hypothetical protein
MNGTIRLEFIGATSADSLRRFQGFERTFGIKDKHHPFLGFGPCVLRMYKDDDGQMRYEYVRGKRDYSGANSKGSRGVYVHYILQADELYWIKEPVSWKRTAIYFAAVNLDGEVKTISDEDAQEWLNAL